MRKNNENSVFYVAEDMEFLIGRYKEFNSIEEAINSYLKLEHPRGVKGIGVVIADDFHWGLVDGQTLEIDMLKYVPEIANESKVAEAINIISKKLPNIKISGNIDEYNLYAGMKDNIKAYLKNLKASPEEAKELLKNGEQEVLADEIVTVLNNIYEKQDIADDINVSLSSLIDKDGFGYSLNANNIYEIGKISGDDLLPLDSELLSEILSTYGKSFSSYEKSVLEAAKEAYLEAEIKDVINGRGESKSFQNEVKEAIKKQQTDAIDPSKKIEVKGKEL